MKEGISMLKFKKIVDNDLMIVQAQSNRCHVAGRQPQYGHKEVDPDCLTDCHTYNKPRYYKSKTN